MGISVSSICKYKKILKEKGKKGLKQACEKEYHGRARTPKGIEAEVVKFSLKNPQLGQIEASKQLRKKGIFLASATLRSIWLRYNIQTIALRTQKTKKQKLLNLNSLYSKRVP